MSILVGGAELTRSGPGRYRSGDGHFEVEYVRHGLALTGTPLSPWPWRLWDLGGRRSQLCRSLEECAAQLALWRTEVASNAAAC